MILDLISERENMSAKVTDEVAVGWGNQQVITGPVLILPYNVVTVTNAQVNVSNVTKKYLVIFPDSLNINGQLETHEKYRNIYKVLLYNSSLTISGKFNLPPDGFSGIAKTDLLWNEATLIQGISDIKGLKSKVTMKMNGNDVNCKSGISGLSFTVDNVPFSYSVPKTEAIKSGQSLIQSGINAPLNSILSESKDSFTFSFPLQLNGCKYLYFTPVGKTTTVQLASTFPDPSFTGAYLPDHKTNQKGFAANWSVLEYNKDFPEYMTYNESIPLGATGFGIEVRELINQYDVTYRTGKYMILFIVLTFLVVFLTEVVYRLRIHIFQYILIGLALVLFFTLLLSVSEFTGFNTAYILSALSTITLLYFYSLSVFQNKKSSLILLVLLMSLFVYIFLIIQLETMALLAGTLGLFVILAATMYATRSIKWYEEKVQ